MVSQKICSVGKITHRPAKNKLSHQKNMHGQQKIISSQEKICLDSKNKQRSSKNMLNHQRILKIITPKSGSTWARWVLLYASEPESEVEFSQIADSSGKICLVIKNPQAQPGLKRLLIMAVTREKWWLIFMLEFVCFSDTSVNCRRH